MPDFVSSLERPFINAGWQRSLDSDGWRRATATLSRRHPQGYFPSAYTARNLGCRRRHAGGSHNLIMVRGGDLDGPAAADGRGLLVTELFGHGINYVTATTARGAAGYWVEVEIVHPVEEITIAGNLRHVPRHRGGRQRRAGARHQADRFHPLILRSTG